MELELLLGRLLEFADIVARLLRDFIKEVCLTFKRHELTLVVDGDAVIEFGELLDLLEFGLYSFELKAKLLNEFLHCRHL